MTISTTTIKNSYNGDGSTTAFTYTFKITDEDHIEVIIRSSNGTETVKTITTHYTVSGVGNAGGGTVTFTAGNIPISGETVILRRDTPQTQGLDLIENDPLPANSLEDAFDKITSITQTNYLLSIVLVNFKLLKRLGPLEEIGQLQLLIKLEI